MSRKRKRPVYVLVKVSACTSLSPAAVRREVRSLINHQAFYHYWTEESDLRAAGVKTVRAPPKRA